MDHNKAMYGVDVSKAKLVLGQYGAQTLTEMDNRMESIAAWLATLPKGTVIAMEATGAYHQMLARMAYTAGMWVFVLNPQAIKHYAQAVGQRGKTDPCDARLIARYVTHELTKLRRWHPPAGGVERLSQLLVRRHAVVVARQTLAQSLSGLSMLKLPRESLLASLDRTLGRLDILIRHEIARLPGMAEVYKRLMSIVGVGPVVAAQLTAALYSLNFARVNSFIAYTGLDPRAADSGMRQGKRRLSKHGPPLLRCQLFNAGRAATSSKLFKPVYKKLLERGLQTTEAIVILARKIARIAYALYKSGEIFDLQRHFKTT